MQLVKGGYVHAANDSTLSITRTPLRTAGDQVYAFRETWNIQTKVIGDDQASLKAAIDAFKIAYSINGESIVLLHNDGSVSTHQLLNAGSLGGVRTVRGPDFPDGNGAEYATYRTGQVTLEAEYPTLDVNLLSYEESISYSGGGALWAHVPLVNGFPQKQLLYEHTPFKAIQRGSAVGYLFPPYIPGPIWPADLKQNGSPTIHAPKRKNDTFTEYAVEWSYEFEAILPLIGLPNAWPA